MSGPRAADIGEPVREVEIPERDPWSVPTEAPAAPERSPEREPVPA